MLVDLTYTIVFFLFLVMVWTIPLLLWHGFWWLLRKWLGA